MQTGIFGLPKVGKTTLFNLMTSQEAATDKFATTRAAANVGFATVADDRVDRLSALFRPNKTTHAQVRYTDIAGLAAGELRAAIELADLRPVDSLLHVVRAFDDDELPHAPGAIDPARDITAMSQELLLADLLTVDKRLEKVRSDLRKRKDQALVREEAILARVHAALEQELPVRLVERSEEEDRLLRGFQLLTAKPVLNVINLGEERQDAAADLAGAFGLDAAAGRDGTATTWVLGKLEMEISQLDAADARAFLDDLGIAESGLDRVIRTTYELLGLESFFTVGDDEVKAWTIRRGTPARAAAGVIHSDIERGFIRAEVMATADLLERRSEKAVREAGLARLEGKEYPVADGDVIHFRFNV